MKNNYTKFFWFVVGCSSLLAVLYLVLNPSGYIKYHRLRTEVDSLHTVIRTLETEDTLLQNSIDSLQKKDKSKIVKIARERYNMRKPNETIISVEEK